MNAEMLGLSLLLLATPIGAFAATFDVRDPAAFARCADTNALLQKLAGGLRFSEGPVWVPRDGGYLVFSDIPANELKRWTARDGLTTFRHPSQNANGNTVDLKGRLISCEHSGRRVSRLESDGTLVALIDRFEGKRFNSPNDAVVAEDGAIYFTDPDYGLGKNSGEIGGRWVFRLDPAARAVRVLVKDFDKPNGIALSPDGRRLYVADSGKPRHIRVFEVQPEGGVTAGRIFCSIDAGVPDGIRCDADGRVWSSAGDGIQVFSPEGRMLGKILVPEAPANLCFGGPDGHTLFITARTSLYAIAVLTQGVSWGKSN